MAHTTIPLTAMLALLAGCQGKPGDELTDEPESLTILSIDGTESWRGTTTGEILYGCPVLGRVEITDPNQRRSVMAAVKSGIQNAPKQPMGCWMPRHVLRLVTGGKKLDVVICFECQSYRSYHGETESARVGGGQISSDPQSLLNDILAQAGVPVVPKLGE